MSNVVHSIRRVPRRDQLVILPIVLAAAKSELGIDIDFDAAGSDRPLIDLILRIIEQGQENGWPLVKLLIETILPLIISLI